MNLLIRKALSVLTAVLLTASMLLAPANASAMIECHGDPTAMSASIDIHVGHAHPMDDLAIQGDASANEHFEGHCSSHACVTAIADSGDAANILLASFYPDHNLSAGSLIAQGSPEGLRRPPRV